MSKARRQQGGPPQARTIRGSATQVVLQAFGMAPNRPAREQILKELQQRHAQLCEQEDQRAKPQA